MIDVIHYLHEPIEKSLVPTIDLAYNEVRNVLPGLAETLQIYFSDYGIIPETGVGGFAYSHTIITLSIDPDFKDEEVQQDDIRSTIYHEAFHQYQKFTGEDEYFGAIESAIYEGMATVFERDYAGRLQPYGDYQTTSDETLASWAELIKQVGDEYKTDEEVSRKWKFYNEDLGERWILYKVGAWIVDQVMKKTEQSVVDLRDMTAREVLELYVK